MAAAYAALLSLINNMEQIMNHPRLSTFIYNKQIASLRDRVDSLLDFIEKNNSQGLNQTLESRIASASYEAEEVIESYIVDRIPASTGKCYKFLPDLHRVIEKIDSIMETVTKVKEETGFKSQQPVFSIPATLTGSPNTGKSIMVGFDEELIQLVDILTRQQSRRQIISLVGMGGSGKSTLAKNVYEHSNIVQYFHVRAWATISQQYSVREILIDLLSSKQKSTSATVEELGLQLHKSLSDQRYLIILDDMWSINVWDKIRIFFPDYKNGSQILLTTRLSNVASHCCCVDFKMKFLDEDKSWILFCETVFGSEDCPLELEGVGKRISTLCKGLPLSVVVIGGLLHRSNRTLGYWNYVAENIKSVLSMGGDDDCSKILSLSYNQLAIHLKPCFLYMGIFREDSEIRASRIIKYWVSEGFIKSNSTEMLEEIAEGYLNDLVDRNLILVGRHRYNGKIRSCRVHDLIRDLCLKVSEKEKFLCVGSTLGVNRERRIIFHDFVSSRGNCEMVETLESEQLFRSLVCRGMKLPVVYRLLRVLNMANDSSLEALLKNLNLRFLTYQPLSYSSLVVVLPSSISLISNLQTLAIYGGDVNLVVAPIEFWDLLQLRHVECRRIYLPDPPLSDGRNELVVLFNLRTLIKAVNLKLSEEVCKRIPNASKLHLTYNDFSEGYDDSLFDHLHNLGSLHQLQSLNLASLHRHRPTSYGDWLKCRFPKSLQKLSMTNGSLNWKDLTVIGSLPQLRVLKLYSSVVGENWSPVCGEFLSLNSLTIESCDLRCWTADDSHFPVLKKLSLEGLLQLEEIPLGIGDIPTLELIRVDCCSKSANISAMAIKEEQESLGNDGLQIEVVKRRSTSNPIKTALLISKAAFTFLDVVSVGDLEDRCDKSLDYL